VAVETGVQVRAVAGVVVVGVVVAEAAESCGSWPTTLSRQTVGSRICLTWLAFTFTSVSATLEVGCLALTRPARTHSAQTSYAGLP